MGESGRTWEHLDQQFENFAGDLRDGLGLRTDQCGRLASLIAAELVALPQNARQEILAADVVPAEARREELIAFQTFMDVAALVTQRPEITRAQVIVQNYICFVYVREGPLLTLAAAATGILAGSVSQQCAKYLLHDKVRAFRNAFS